MSALSNILYYSCYFLRKVILPAYFLSSVLEPRKRVKYPFLAFACLQVFSNIISLVLIYPFTLMSLGWTEESLLSIVLWLIPLISALLYFKGSFISRIIAYSLAACVTIIAELIPLIIIFAFSALFTDTVWANTVTDLNNTSLILNIVYLTIISSVPIVMMLSLTNFLKIRFSSYHPIALLQISLPIIIIWVLMNFSFVFMEHFIFMSVVYLALAFLSLALLIRGLTTLKTEELLRLKKISRQEMITKQAIYMKSLEQEYHTIQKWNHDINNHLEAVTLLIEANDVKSTLVYIDTLLDQGGDYIDL